jgi:four helix bundle protein
MSQMRRAAASIGTNLAEGCCRSSDADFARFVQIALGSASELEYQMLLARDLNLMAATEYAPLAAAVERTKRMLTALVKTLGKAA